jgi:TM2 domain-containing membrane protein YozV
MSTKQTDKVKPRSSTTARVFGGIGIGLLGFVLYWVCDGMFDGFPKYNSYFWTWVFVIALVLFGAIVWIRDERRHRDDED